MDRRRARAAASPGGSGGWDAPDDGGGAGNPPAAWRWTRKWYGRGSGGGPPPHRPVRRRWSRSQGAGPGGCCPPFSATAAITNTSRPAAGGPPAPPSSWMSHKKELTSALHSGHTGFRASQADAQGVHRAWKQGCRTARSASGTDSVRQMAQVVVVDGGDGRRAAASPAASAADCRRGPGDCRACRPAGAGGSIRASATRRARVGCGPGPCDEKNAGRGNFFLVPRRSHFVAQIILLRPVSTSDSLPPSTPAPNPVRHSQTGTTCPYLLKNNGSRPDQDAVGPGRHAQKHLLGRLLPGHRPGSRRNAVARVQRRVAHHEDGHLPDRAEHAVRGRRLLAQRGRPGLGERVQPGPQQQPHGALARRVVLRHERQAGGRPKDRVGGSHQEPPPGPAAGAASQDGPQGRHQRHGPAQQAGRRRGRRTNDPRRGQGRIGGHRRGRNDGAGQEFVGRGSGCARRDSARSVDALGGRATGALNDTKQQGKRTGWMMDGWRATARKTHQKQSGTGYLGQWVVDELLTAGWAVAVFYHDAADPGMPPAWPGKGAARVTAYPVDLATGRGLDEAFTAIKDLAGVVNCAAISSPAACEADPAAAAALNVPAALLASLRKACPSTRPVFVQLSTDQCYAGEGTPATGWSEGAPLRPVNAYARTKADAEAAVLASWPENALILRCSVMIGSLPQPAWPLAPGRLTFLQFAAATVKQAAADSGGGGGGQGGLSFFTDEWRSFVGVRDVARVCAQAVTDRPPVSVGSTPVTPTVVNVGGPARLSRADLARVVAAKVGVPPTAVVESRATDAVRPVASPADITMDVSLLRNALGFEPRSVEAVVEEELLG